jgi:hypothetical protein
MASLPDPKSASSTDDPKLMAMTGGEVPPPPPEMCTECIDAVDQHHYFTTVSGCLAAGDTPYGAPFPCPVTPTEREALFDKKIEG